MVRAARSLDDSLVELRHLFTVGGDAERAYGTACVRWWPGFRVSHSRAFAARGFDVALPARGFVGPSATANQVELARGGAR